MLNGMPAPRLYVRASVGDVIAVNVDDEIPITPGGVCAVPIVYEDEDVLILSKPAGMAVHAAGMTALAGTVAEAVSAYLGGRPLHCVNRLDRGTSGLMAVAKSSYAHECLRQSLHTEAMRREYRAIVQGRLVPSQGVIDLPIARDPASAIRRRVDPDGAPSRTLYETLEAGEEYSLLRMCPETGRTHQIRVHMAAIGHPLFGDWLYGSETPELITRPALHACRLVMRSPVTGEEIDVSAPMPEDMTELLEKLR